MRLGRAILLCICILFAAPAISQTPSPGLSPAPVVENESPSQPGLQANIARMFANNEYDTIDRIAYRARTEKTRLRGGIWSLKHIYNGLSMPSQDGYDTSIARLTDWIAHNPQSITARVALAEVYYKYGWVARGSGYADSVTPEGQKLFLDRVARAHTVLDEASSLNTKCPQWYSLMLSIARSQGWDEEKTDELFNKAVAFEPGYFDYYDSYADYLLPEWEGKSGESAAFAKQVADHIGGQQGDFVYFEIAAHVVGASNPSTEGLDWTRVQRGHDALAQLYTSVNFDRNQYALLAWRFKDTAVANQQFALIGDKWAPTIWQDQDQFNSVKSWAAQQPLAASPVSMAR